MALREHWTTSIAWPRTWTAITCTTRRAAFLHALGRHAEAAEADARALRLTKNPAERALLSERLTGEA
jgi:predicted RNA polymerase sigma factor